MKFRKKPVEIEAVEWRGDNYDEINNFTTARFRLATLPSEPEVTAQIHDDLHSTWVSMRTGDWVIRGVQGEFYPIRPDVLAATYDAVEA